MIIDALRGYRAERTFRRRLEESVPWLLQAETVPGLALSLVRDGRATWDGAFGARRSDAGDPVTPNTVFEAGSLGKPVFAYTVLQLCHEGVLDLDTPLDDYLSSPCVPGDRRSPRITTRRVLSHTTGLPYWRRTGEALATYVEPGERFLYSGEAFIVLQHVVERATGRSPSALLSERAFGPAGMLDSTFVWDGTETQPFALGHRADGTVVRKSLWPKTEVAGSLHTTARDVAAFLCHIMNDPVIARDMLKAQGPVNDRPWHRDAPLGSCAIDERVSWGLGWGLGAGPDGTSFWHWGDNGCYRAFAIAYPDEGCGVAILTNSENGQRVIARILRDVAGGAYPELDWLDRACES
ncbi:MAG: serine hydrolase [Candidatus Bipolaricaulis sp.]|nr:serine hydrolase [Candidatus Bipolaricaulis sp.]